MASKRKPRYWIINLDADGGQEILYGPVYFGKVLFHQLRWYVDVVELKNCVIVQEVINSEQTL